MTMQSASGGNVDSDAEMMDESDGQSLHDMAGKTGHLVVADDTSETECDFRLVDYNPMLQGPKVFATVVGERFGATGTAVGFTEGCDGGGGGGSGRGSRETEVSPTSQHMRQS